MKSENFISKKDSNYVSHNWQPLRKHTHFTPNLTFATTNKTNKPVATTLKVLHPSGPNYWKNVEWIPYVFCKEYCSECQTNRVMGQTFGTNTFCHL